MLKKVLRLMETLASTLPKGVYLGSAKARHPKYNIAYNDISKRSKPDLLCSMETVDLSKYDYFIASPPCNFWSHANPDSRKSEYALKTKHLLLWCLENIPKQGKPFIIENVRNAVKYEKYGVFDLVRKQGLYLSFVGRHTYITNILVNLECYQTKDFKKGGICLVGKTAKQGGANVHRVIEIWLKHIHANIF